MYGGRSNGGVGGRSERNSYGGGEEEQAGGDGRAGLGGEEGRPSSQEAPGPTDFSVHRLLPPPSIAFPPPRHLPQLPNSDHPTPPTGLPSAGMVGTSQRNNNYPPVPEQLGPHQWVGYGHPHQQPYTDHLVVPGRGEQRWPPHQLYQPYPMPGVYPNLTPTSPYHNPPSTPGHHPHQAPHPPSTPGHHPPQAPQPPSTPGHHPHQAPQPPSTPGHHPPQAPHPPSTPGHHPPQTPHPPSTPGHHPHQAPQQHHEGSSPQDHRSPQGNSSSMHLHHPANAGLYTLCQAATMSSSLPEHSPYHTYHHPQSNPHPQLNQHHQIDMSRPPPPYVQFYAPGQPHNPFNHLQTSPHSPHPPHAYHHPNHQHQQQMIVTDPTKPPSPSFLNQVPADGIVQDGEQPGSHHHQSSDNLGQPAEGILTQQSSTESHCVPPVSSEPQLSYSLQQENSLSQASSSSSSSLIQHTPLAIVQDGEQPGPSYPSTAAVNYGGIEQQQTPSGAPLEVSSSFANIVRDGEQPGPSYVEQTSAQLPNEDSEGGLVARFSRHEGLTTDSGSVQHPNPPPLPPSPTSPSPPPRTHGRGKRTRTAYTQAQQDALELAFHANPYPDGFYRQKVSKHVGIAEDRIQVWFQNRRARGKKQSRTGSVSHRSHAREERLKLHLATITRRADLMKAAARRFALQHAQNPAFNIQLQSQPLLEQQQQQQQQLAEQHHLENQPSMAVASGVHPTQEMVEQQFSLQDQPPQPQLDQQETSSGEARGPTPHNNTGDLSNNQLQISAPFSLLQSASQDSSIATTTSGGAENPSFPLPLHSETLTLEQPSVMFNSHSSTICYFPQQPPNQDQSNQTQFSNLPLHQPHPMYVFPQAQGPPQPLPPIQHLYPPNPPFHFPSPSQFRPLLPPPSTPPHHLRVEQRRSMSSPGGEISPQDDADGDRSLSAPSSVATTSGAGGNSQPAGERAGPQQERLPSSSPNNPPQGQHHQPE